MKKTMIAILGLLLVSSVLLASAKSQGGDEKNKGEMKGNADSDGVITKWDNAYSKQKPRYHKIVDDYDKGTITFYDENNQMIKTHGGDKRRRENPQIKYDEDDKEILFINKNGKTIKSLKKRSLGTKMTEREEKSGVAVQSFRTSQDKKYIAVVPALTSDDTFDSDGNNTTKVQYYDWRGELLWEKTEIEYALVEIAISGDGGRVFLVFSDLKSRGRGVGASLDYESIRRPVVVDRNGNAIMSLSEYQGKLRFSYITQNGKYGLFVIMDSITAVAVFYDLEFKKKMKLDLESFDSSLPVITEEGEVILVGHFKQLGDIHSREGEIVFFHDFSQER